MEPSRILIAMFVLLTISCFDQTEATGRLPVHPPAQIEGSKHLLHEMQTQDHGVSKKLQQGITEDSLEEELTINGKMDLESSTHDYPGPGPNPRHNPRPPVGRN
ncbi:hypothetical protein FRX31_019634 [Thalictrum thalictroides]|uniref:Uncharacterized protein n=1 Tax=Thalictrum thalictroides TaxID=46969 RepID=A0A7J6W0U4_THATH|nr:hypothetical protein FRX31_019634 [Thalictrum thalictroides]